MTLMHGGGGSAVLTQDSFRFRTDIPDEDDDTEAFWYTALNENWLPTAAELAANYRIRIGMRCTDPLNDADGSFDQLRIQMSYNKGGFTNITASSTPIQSSTSTNPPSIFISLPRISTLGF